MNPKRHTGTSLRRRRYLIRRATAPVCLQGKVSGTAWAEASTLRISNFPWYVSGVRRPTTVRALYDDLAIYLLFRCADTHISAQTTQLNGPVCLDSCVEFFATTAPDQGCEYFNLEINCCGTILMGFGAGRDSRRLIAPDLARRISVVTSVSGPAKTDSPHDRSWWVAACIPFDVISQFTGREISIRKGTRWRGNFYRCGGRVDEQFACWNNIRWREPDYHRPEQFGDLTFA